MKTDGKISESYYGIPLNEKAHFEAQGRIAWICQRVQGSKILDVGCNQGIVSILLARAGKKVTGIDIDGDSIEYAREELAAESDSTRKRLDIIQGDVLQQAFKENSFDTVIIDKSIEYVREPETLLDLARRICKPDGRVIITTPFGLPEYPDYERIFYLYRFAVLASHFYKFRELDVVGKYIAFSGEPQAGKDTGISETPLLDQEWHRRIHRLSEEEFEQLEIKHRITLLSHSARIKALLNRIEDYRADKQMLQSTIEGLKRDRQALKIRVESLKNDKRALQGKINELRSEHSQKIEAFRASVTFQVGEALVSAVRLSKATITLPFRLWRIYRGYKSKQSRA